MAFAGYLLKSGNDELPNKYIDWNSYDSSPYQREEIKAERDDNTRDLIRVTAPGTKTAIHFKTRDGMHLAEKEAFITWLSSHYVNSDAGRLQRRISPLTYWNDETSAYVTSTASGNHGGFYVANFKFPIKHITENDIIYGSVDIDLIEY